MYHAPLNWWRMDLPFRPNQELLGKSDRHYESKEHSLLRSLRRQAPQPAPGHSQNLEAQPSSESQRSSAGSRPLSVLTSFFQNCPCCVCVSSSYVDYLLYPPPSAWIWLCRQIVFLRSRALWLANDYQSPAIVLAAWSSEHVRLVIRESMDVDCLYSDFPCQWTRNQTEVAGSLHLPHCIVIAHLPVF